MLTVTSIAKLKLKEALEERSAGPGTTFRLALSPKLKHPSISLDKERQGDNVVESAEGTKLLLIGPDVVPEVSRGVLDYKKTPQETGFMLIFDAGT